MSFIQVFFVFIIISTISLLWPLLRNWRDHKRQLREDARSEISGAIIQDRVLELEETKALGEISEAEFRSLQRDLEDTIAAEQSIEPESSRAITFGGKSRNVLIGISFLLPLFVLVVYSNIGAKPDWEIADISKTLQSSKESSKEDRLELIQKVKDRLQATPDNGHLLFLLANLSSEVGDFEEAVRAYSELKEMFPESPVVHAELAQALFLRAGNVITPQVRENTELALAIDPRLPTALGFAGIDAFQQGQYQQAISHWQTAVQQLDPSSPAAQFLSQGIVSAQIAIQRTAGQENEPSSEPDVSPEIVVDVSLSEKITELSGDETVFVYARAWQGAKIPLAIQRLAVSDLPTTVRLDKSMAMAQGMDITSSPQLEVVARVSKSGSPAPQSGDWTASFGPVLLADGDAKLELNIVERVP